MTSSLRLFLLVILVCGSFARADSPNVVLIFCDDLGYADVGCYGSKIATPNVDRLAAEGVRFTDFYVAQAVCSASRAALLTGCYSNRVGIQGALHPGAKVGINADETTMAEMFKSRGYATAIFGKWHLGDAPQFNPTRHGFDEFFGLPYSNDMWPKHPERKFPDLPLLDGEKVVEINPDQRKLTTWYTERAVDFIKRKKDGPFFLYVPHSMPHVPLFVSDKFAGKSGQGLYGDVIQEIDWSVGEIIAALEKHQLAERTLVIFTSDNGPWLSYGDHAGSAGELREGKGTAFEGGVRVPCIMRWPGNIEAGAVSKKLATTMDLLPTFASMVGAELPADRKIDGRDISAVIMNEADAPAHDTMLYYWLGHLHAVREGKWKLHLPHTFGTPTPPGAGGKAGKMTQQRIELSLFDLEADAGETRNLAAEHPQVVERLQALADKAREDLGDGAVKLEGKNVRPPGRIEE